MRHPVTRDQYEAVLFDMDGGGHRHGEHPRSLLEDDVR
jgi:hypothetical protein